MVPRPPFWNTKGNDLKKTKNIELPEGAPAPYVELSEQQLQYYAKVCEMALECSTLQNIDAVLLQQMAIVMDLAEQARQAIREKGAIQIYAKTGARAVSPEVQLLFASLDRLEKLGDKFGLSPKAREAIGLNLKKPTFDPLDNL